MPDLFRAVGHRVDQFLGRDFPLGGRLRDLLAVFVHPDEKMHVVAEEAMITCNYIGADFLEGVALVWISGGVVDRRCELVLGHLMAGRRRSLRRRRLADPSPSRGLVSRAGSLP